MVYRRVEDLIGNTPLLELSRFAEKHSLKANVYAKLEFLNPAGSVKDRVALKMILDAEKNGLIKPGDTLVEPTSGNTGIGIAAVGIPRGYKVKIVMPDTMSAERIQIIKAYGAEIVLTDGAKGMSGAIKKAEDICNGDKSCFLMGQFTNESNPAAHYETTGAEIFDDLNGEVDIFISAVGTGGTITGTGAYLKKLKPNVKVVAVEPADSPVLSGGNAGAHKIQGIGAGFVPDVLDLSVIDEIITVSNEDAYSFGRDVAKLEGLLVGISSGAALCAAAKLAELEENCGKNIVIILPDTGLRYLSTENYF